MLQNCDGIYGHLAEVVASLLQVSSIKSGLWDSMYDTFQTVGQLTDNHPDNCPEYVNIDVEPSIKDEKSTKDAPVIPEHAVEHRHSE